MPIYQFPDKKKVNIRKKEATKKLIENANKLINEYDPKQDPALKRFKRKMMHIWRL